MSLNRAQNLVLCCFCAFVFGYVLSDYISTYRLLYALGACGVIFLYGLASKKQQDITYRIDMYILLAVLGVLAIRHDELISAFHTDTFNGVINEDPGAIILLYLGGLLLGLILFGIAKKRKSLTARIILKYFSLLLINVSVTLFFTGYTYAPLLLQQIFIFALFAVIELCRSKASAPDITIRVPYIAFLLALISAGLYVFFPRFYMLNVRIEEFITASVLPWQIVLALSLLGLLLAGVRMAYGGAILHMGILFFAGIAGLSWVIKASLYFYYSLSWTAPCVYFILLFYFLSRFVRQPKKEKGDSLFPSPFKNELFCILACALGTVVSVRLINTGYIYFWLSLVVGLPLIRYALTIATGWVKDAVFWQSVLFSTAAGACALVMQYGYLQYKIILITAMFAFSSAAMWMMNYKNTIGFEGFKRTKAVMAAVFCLLVLIPIFRGSVDIEAVVVDKSICVGSLMRGENALTVSARVDGGNIGIKRISCVWTESFRYEKENIKGIQNGAVMEIENNHLIIWAEDSSGVVSRNDYWFY